MLGALRVAEVLNGGQSVSELSHEARARAALNVHLSGDERLREHHRIFIGDPDLSSLFSHAVNLGGSVPDGLIYRTFTAAGGKPLSFNKKPAWHSSLRSCRPMWTLARAIDKERAEVVRQAVSARNDFDFFKGLQPA